MKKNLLFAGAFAALAFLSCYLILSPFVRAAVRIVTGGLP